MRLVNYIGTVKSTEIKGERVWWRGWQDLIDESNKKNKFCTEEFRGCIGKVW